MELEQLRAKGGFVAPDIEFEVRRDVKQRKAEYDDRVNQIGVPDKLKGLLSTTRKAEAEQYSRNIVLSEYDLFLLIHNCAQIRFAHRSKFKQYVPEHLVVSKSDRDEMIAGHPRKFVTKFNSVLLERKYVHAHLFEFSSAWHCFYFTHQDIDPTNNHWRHGPHLHYVSHLWPNLKKRLIWNRFNQRYTEISGSLYIRFEPFEFPRADEVRQDHPRDGSKSPMSAVVFDPSLAGGCGSPPAPVAQMATRGMWFATVSRRPESSPPQSD